MFHTKNLRFLVLHILSFHVIVENHMDYLAFFDQLNLIKNRIMCYQRFGLMAA